MRAIIRPANARAIRDGASASSAGSPLARDRIRRITETASTAKPPAAPAPTATPAATCGRPGTTKAASSPASAVSEITHAANGTRVTDVAPKASFGWTSQDDGEEVVEADHDPQQRSDQRQPRRRAQPAVGPVPSPDPEQQGGHENRSEAQIRPGAP